MGRNLDLDLARTFVAIADTGSFSRAAARLNLAPPTVSLQMKRLEGFLRQALFTKNGRGRELTDSGRALLAFARKLLQINDMALAEMMHRLWTAESGLGRPKSSRMRDSLICFVNSFQQIRRCGWTS